MSHTEKPTRVIFCDVLKKRAVVNVARVPSERSLQTLSMSVTLTKSRKIEDKALQGEKRNKTKTELNSSCHHRFAKRKSVSTKRHRPQSTAPWWWIYLVSILVFFLYPYFFFFLSLRIHTNTFYYNQSWSVKITDLTEYNIT